MPAREKYRRGWKAFGKASGAEVWVGLRPGRKASKGKKELDPCGVLPFRDRQDFKQQMTWLLI